MENTPLVSIICLAFNHEQFVREALHSVLHQSYPNIELIILDDASSDHTALEIDSFVQKNSQLFVNLIFLQNAKNEGVCRQFNKGFVLSKGKYLIDLAADDKLHHERIAKQVSLFESLPESYGFISSDARIINEEGCFLKHYFDKKDIPEDGDIFEKVLRPGAALCTPTLMFRRKAVEALGGYDENLAYEDYDFLIRISRTCKHAFLPEAMTDYRKTKGSLSSYFYRPQKEHRILRSTLTVCLKAEKMINREEEKEALISSVLYHGRLALMSGDYKCFHGFESLFKRLSQEELPFYYRKPFRGLVGMFFRVFYTFRLRN